MATIDSLGIGSGLDLSGLLDKMSTAEKAPLDAITTRRSGVSAKISAYGMISSMLGTLNVSGSKLGDPSFMGAFQATSSATTVLSATGDATSVAGSYAVTVTKLAQAQSLVSAGVASTTSAIGGGAAAGITIDFGTVTGSLNGGTGTFDPGASFVADATKSAITVPIVAGKTSLAEVRDAVNAAAGTALTASIVNDGTNNRLVLTSASTGQSTSMRVTVTGANAGLSALLGNDPAASQAMRQTVAAQDAALTVNGIAVTSGTNTVTGSIQGVTMSLTDLGTTVVKVARNSASITQSVNDFVSGYNALTAKLKALSAYDVSKKTGGALLGDSAVRTIQQQLRAAMFTVPNSVHAGDPKVLSDVGIGFQLDGTLSVNADKLNAALASNPAGVARLFAGDSTNPGVADSFTSIIGLFTDPKKGLLQAATDGANSDLKLLAKDYQRTSDEIDAKIAAQRAQFQRLDQVMSGLTATSNYLTAQFNPKTTSK